LQDEKSTLSLPKSHHLAGILRSISERNRIETNRNGRQMSQTPSATKPKKYKKQNRNQNPNPIPQPKAST